MLRHSAIVANGYPNTISGSLATADHCGRLAQVHALVPPESHEMSRPVQSRQSPVASLPRPPHRSSPAHLACCNHTYRRYWSDGRSSRESSSQQACAALIVAR